MINRIQNKSCLHYICTVDIKSLHTPVKMTGFCDVKKNETKINHFRTFSTFDVNYNLYNSIKKQTEIF